MGARSSHPTRTLTSEGLEATLAVNYLAPFLLTELLLDAFRRAHQRALSMSGLRSRPETLLRGKERQALVFVHRAGHCTFTPAETLTAFQTLIQRLNTGKWEDSTNPDLMNQEATALGPNLNVLPEPFPNGTPVPTPPAFLNFQPTLFLRSQ